MKMVSDNHNEMSHSIFGVLGKDRDAQAIPIQYQNYFYSKANKKKNKNKLIKNQSKTFSLKHHQYYDLQKCRLCYIYKV